MLRSSFGHRETQGTAMVDRQQHAAAAAPADGSAPGQAGVTVLYINFLYFLIDEKVDKNSSLDQILRLTCIVCVLLHSNWSTV